MAFALREDRDQHVGARHLLAARGLHVHDGAMNDPLERRRRLGLRRAAHDQRAELVVEIGRDAPAQLIEIDVARAHDGGSVAVVDQREQQMLQRRVLVMALVGELERTVKRSFETLRE